MANSSSLIFNIETIARPDLPTSLLPSIEDIEVPANYKNPEAIQGYRERKLVELVDRLPLSPLTGKIICIGVDSPVIGGRNVVVSEDEAHLVTIFNDAFEEIYRTGKMPILVGFNSIDFDLPFLMIAAMRNRLDLATGRETHNYLNRYGSLHFDLYTKLTGGYRKPGTLGDWATAMGLQTIYGNGSMVAGWWSNGKLDDIRTHCESNINATAQLYEIYRRTIGEID